MGWSCRVFWGEIDARLTQIGSKPAIPLGGSGSWQPSTPGGHPNLASGFGKIGALGLLDSDELNDACPRHPERFLKNRLCSYLGITLIAFSILSWQDRVLAEVFLSKEEAFELAFGQGAEVEVKSLFLTDDQARRIEQTGQTKLDGNLYSLYAGRKDGKLLGYAALESHTVRSQAETVLIVLSPSGEVRRVVIAAFHEPPEYLPVERWLLRLTGKKPEELRLGQGVDGIAGATMSCRAVTDGVRKVATIFRVAMTTGEN